MANTISSQTTEILYNWINSHDQQHHSNSNIVAKKKKKNLKELKFTATAARRVAPGPDIVQMETGLGLGLDAPTYSGDFYCSSWSCRAQAPAACCKAQRAVGVRRVAGRGLRRWSGSSVRRLGVSGSEEVSGGEQPRVSIGWSRR